MKQTISDLWNGEIAPIERCGVRDVQANQLMHIAAQNREALRGELSEAQKEKLQKLLDCSEQYMLRMMELSFRDGFSLGVKLTAEAMN